MVDSIGGMGSFNPSSMIQQMQDRRFNAIDKNGDGKIDKTELSQMLTNDPRLGGVFSQILASGTNGSQGSPSVDDIFSKLDTDKDGTISKSELTAAMDQIRQQMQDRRFNAIDKNGDGKIDKTELSQMLVNGTKGSQGSPSVDDIFNKLDTDKDGTISKSELTAAMDQIRSKRHGHHHHAQSISNSVMQDNNSSSVSVSQILNGLTGTDANSALKIYLQSSVVSGLSSASSQGTQGADAQTSLASALAALYA